VIESPTAWNPETARSDQFAQCVCNLHPNICDAFCCCDPDCTNEQKDLFKDSAGNELCLLPTYRYVNSMKCVSQTEVTFSNLPPGLASEIASQNGLFCVYYDQSPVTGNTQYYDAVSDLTSESDVTSTVVTAMQISYPKKMDFSQVFDATTTTQTSTTGYRLGNKIPIATYVSSTTVLPQNYLSVSGPGFSAECNTFGQFGTFQERIHPARSCVQKITNLADACASGGALNMLTYYDSLYIARTSVGGTSMLSYVPIEVRSGSESSNATYSTSGGTFSCSSAVKKLTYILSYSDTTNAITKAEILVETQTVSTSTAPSTSAPLYVEQEFSLIFDDASNSGLVNNTLQSRSGNPGYVLGSVVKAGRVETQDSLTAVQERINGLQVYSGSLCTDQVLVDVGFGEDLISSCKLTLTQAELEALCTQIRDDSSSEVPFISHTQLDDRLGRYGNAQSINSSDWIQIYSSARPSPTWTSADASCSNIGATLKMNIVIARSGSVVNEQWEVIGAHREQLTTTWKFDTTLGTTNDFYLQWRVNFVHLPSQERGQKLYPVPTLLPQLPNDVFYPFNLVFGAAPAQSIPVALLVALLSAGMIIVS